MPRLVAPAFPSASVAADVGDGAGGGGDEVAEFHIGAAVFSVDLCVDEFQGQVDETLRLDAGALQRCHKAVAGPVSQAGRVLVAEVLANQDDGKLPAELDQPLAISFPEDPARQFVFNGRRPGSGGRRPLALLLKLNDMINSFAGERIGMKGNCVF